MRIKSKTVIQETQVDVDSLIIEMITRKMRDLLGEASTVVFFAFLEKKHGLPRDEIPNKPQTFTDVLASVLGSSAVMVESLIVKELCSSLGLRCEEKKAYRFAECVKEIRKSYLT